MNFWNKIPLIKWACFYLRVINFFLSWVCRLWRHVRKRFFTKLNFIDQSNMGIRDFHSLGKSGAVCQNIIIEDLLTQSEIVFEDFKNAFLENSSKPEGRCCQKLFYIDRNHWNSPYWVCEWVHPEHASGCEQVLWCTFEGPRVNVENFGKIDA